jgi:hypothetical protein
MKHNLFFLFFLCVFTNVTAQNFPHLNASTGNKNEFIVDADSNVFMFHGGRIEKLDKNFNPVWINSYSGLTFKNLLLSKTGSLYFIAIGITGSNSIDRLGKIEANGSLTWCKTLPTYTATISGNTQTVSLTNADQMLLDRNSDLVITGSTNTSPTIYLLKLDTLSNFKKLNLITNGFMLGPLISTIINDVSGKYTVSSLGYGFEGPVYNLVYKYSDISNLIIKDSLFQISYMGMTNQYPSSNEHIIKSKNQSNVFYLAYNTGANSSTLSNTFSLKKIKSNSIIWGIEFQTSAPYYMIIENIEEDHLKNTFVSISTMNVSTDKHDKWIMKIDSNGLCDNQKYNLLQNFGKASYTAEDSITQLKHHFGNNFFYSIESTSSLVGPLSITKMDSTIGSYCSPTASISVFGNNSYQYQLGSVGHTTLTTVTSPTMQIITSTVTSVSSFSVIINSCLALWISDNDNPNGGFSIYPNPTTNILNINTSYNYSSFESSIFDVHGKQILTMSNTNSIDVSKLNNGIYFIKIKTDKGEFNQKFIKQ